MQQRHDAHYLFLKRVLTKKKCSVFVWVRRSAFPLPLRVRHERAPHPLTIEKQ